MTPLPIPSADPLGIPGPVWLMQALSCLTLFLHFLAANLALGGTLLAVLARGRGDGAGDRLAAWHFRFLPVFIAATVTLAIPPLLFLQVLYGPFFYSASVLTAVPWFSLLFLMGAGYLLAYLLNFKWESRKTRAGWVGGAIVLLFSGVALVLTTLTLLSLHPDRWSALYGDPHLGLKWDGGLPTLLPRYLHLWLASPAVAGAFFALLGQGWIRKGLREGDWVAKYGTAWFLAVTLVQFGVGTWFLLSHPRNLWMAVMGGNLAATGAFMTAMGAILVSMILYGVGFFKPRAYGFTWSGWICLLVTLISMTAVRLHLRDLELKPYLDGLWVTHEQWGFILIFLALLVAGFGTVGWMLVKVFGKKPAA